MESEQEIEEAIVDQVELFKEFYQVNNQGYWEDGQYQLIRVSAPEEFAKTKLMTTLMIALETFIP